MDVKELWIGDRMRVKSINEIGKFEGVTAKGNFIIRLNIGTVEVSSDDVTLILDEDTPNKIDKIIDEKPAKQITAQKNEIDLHLEALQPQLAKSEFKNILSYQIAACRKFIQQAIKRKEPFVTIIHGKGEGILKEAIQKLLIEFDESIFAKQSANQGGAILVYFKM